MEKKLLVYCSYHKVEQLNHVHKDEIPCDTTKSTLDHRFWCELATMYDVFRGFDMNRKKDWPKKYDLIGFTHYRRHFPIADIPEKHFDTVIVPKPFDCKTSIRDQFIKAHGYRNFDMLCERLDNPEIFNTEKMLYPCNMFIMPRLHFNIYAGWLFDILFEMSSLIHMGSNDYQNRVLGFMAERLFTYWVISNKIPCKEVDLI